MCWIGERELRVIIRAIELYYICVSTRVFPLETMYTFASLNFDQDLIAHSRFCYNSILSIFNPGPDFVKKTVTVENRSVTLNIWDTVGQERLVNFEKILEARIWWLTRCRVVVVLWWRRKARGVQLCQIVMVLNDIISSDMDQGKTQRFAVV